MIVFVGVLAVLAWLGAIIWLFLQASDILDRQWSIEQRIMFGVASAVLLAGGIALAVSSDNEDPRLCLHGHQVYVEHRQAKGGTYETKTWVCDQWEAQ